jgi:hypothetical protein
MPVLVLIVLLLSVPAFAQMQSRPTDPPVVTAASESWYQQREPLLLGGDAYYPAGAAVFFNGNVMVRTGHYNGVPLYSDATLAPYSVIYVPIGRGQLQPYERPRRGELGGSVSSRLSGFPVRAFGDPTTDVTAMGVTAVAATQLPYSAGAISTYTPEAVVFTPFSGGTFVPAVAVRPVAAPTAALAVDTIPEPFVARVIITPHRPDTNDGVWLQYDSQRWVSNGRAEARTADFQQVGSLGGRPVLRRTGGDADLIYVPTRDGVVAPFRRKG